MIDHDQADRVRNAIRASLDALVLLRYDWDGEDGLPIRPDVAHFIRCRYCGLGWAPRLDKLTIPRLSMSSDGTVSIRYQKYHRVLTLEVQCDSVILFTQSYDNKQSTVNGRIDIDVSCKDVPNCYAELDEISDWVTWSPWSSVKSSK